MLDLMRGRILFYRQIWVESPLLYLLFYKGIEFSECNLCLLYTKSFNLVQASPSVLVDVTTRIGSHFTRLLLLLHGHLNGRVSGLQCDLSKTFQQIQQKVVLRWYEIHEWRKDRYSKSCLVQLIHFLPVCDQDHMVAETKIQLELEVQACHSWIKGPQTFRDPDSQASANPNWRGICIHHTSISFTTN